MSRLIPVLVVAVVVIGCVLIVLIDKWASKARQNRLWRRRHEAFLDKLHIKCLDARDVEPFAAVVADDIRKHLASKETK